MNQFVTRAPLFGLRALGCIGLAAAATSCGVRESTSAQEPPRTAYHLYVSPAGVDTAVGTEEAPFRSIERASQAAFPDTTVHVAPGRYPGGFKTLTNGTAKARVYYVSTVRGGAKIVPPPNSASQTAWDNRGNYVDIVGFEVDGSAHQGGVRWMTGIYNGGSYDSIRHNHVHHVATSVTCSSTDGAGIGIESYYRGIKAEVIGNQVHDIGPAGCQAIQGININTSALVANNIVYRTAYAGIHLWRDANNVTVVNNTVAASTYGIVVGGGDYFFTSGPNDNTHVANNIVFDNKHGITESGATGKHNTNSNNLVSQNSSGDWSLANGLAPTASVAAAPQFIAYDRTGTPDFRLASTSPAIGKGNAARTLPVDFKGMPRSGGVDIGAWQH